jgi:predicted transcriptional regulator
MPKKTSTKRFAGSSGGRVLGGKFPEELHRRVEAAATRLRIGKTGVMLEAIELYLAIAPFWQNMLRDSQSVFGKAAGEVVGEALAEWMNRHTPGKLE